MKMTKAEIIEAITTTTVPEGAQLALFDMPGGFSMAKVDGQSVGGLAIIEANLVASQFVIDTENFPDEPTSALFAQLHSASLGWYQAMIEGTMIDCLQDEAVADHRKTIGCLRRIAMELGITYVEPEDHLLDTRA